MFAAKYLTTIGPPGIEWAVALCWTRARESLPAARDGRWPQVQDGAQGTLVGNYQP